MGIFQAFNNRMGAWVKYSTSGGRSKIKNVKQQNPKTPFKGVPKRGKRK